MLDETGRVLGEGGRHTMLRAGVRNEPLAAGIVDATTYEKQPRAPARNPSTKMTRGRRRRRTAAMPELKNTAWAPHPQWGDRVLFVFDGGILTRQDIAAIRLQPEELDSYEFLPPAEALDRLIPRLRRRVSAALQAKTDSRTMYLEHGVPH
jgi:hypothetical protein